MNMFSDNRILTNHQNIFLRLLLHLVNDMEHVQRQLMLALFRFSLSLSTLQE